MISAADLINLYKSIEGAQSAREKDARACQFDDAVEAYIRELFDDPRFPKRRRSFGVIRKGLVYFDDDAKALHHHLVRIGGRCVNGDGDDALWYLPERTSADGWGRAVKRRLPVLIGVVLLGAFVWLATNFEEITRRDPCETTKDPLDDGC